MQILTPRTNTIQGWTTLKHWLHKQTHTHPYIWCRLASKSGLKSYILVDLKQILKVIPICVCSTTVFGVHLTSNLCFWPINKSSNEEVLSKKIVAIKASTVNFWKFYLLASWQIRNIFFNTFISRCRCALCRGPELQSDKYFTACSLLFPLSSLHSAHIHRTPVSLIGPF